ncbi:flagellar motor switch protein G [Planococcus antarcticus DSM 14505]|uniref:Flagellar motor switch protein FliG n=1 Tax=Planococcus antarcticus DSM 14505 TaxID=1185653 RepID=A0A1C7DCK2_9BACL|nr:flagellar motor switch protein FliG [Planococcus antarcticus]ANU09175.1 flagellar motor switch protein FliG [Planococcus antarcticus DSM 14505]EIM08483.1 flagellar motor switch protein G [Planococcus antarcticus DSM 14505]
MVRGMHELTGIQKVAILLVGLGPDVSIEIFKQLTEPEIDQLTMEISNVRQLRNSQTERVINEFYEMILAQDYMNEGGLVYARNILEQALGKDKAMDTISRLSNRLQVKPFSFARKADPSQILNILQHEQAQTIALVLSYLDAKQSSKILSELPSDKQAEVARRIALMESTSPDVIHQVEQILERKLTATGTQDYTATGGVEAIVRVLSNVDRGTEKSILTELEKDNPELVTEIKKRMFVFEDIVKLETRSVQRIVREVSDADLTFALKVASEEVKDSIYRNMSTRRAEAILEEIEVMGPVKLKDVENAQTNIVGLIRSMEEKGEIDVSRGGGEEIIV